MSEVNRHNLRADFGKFSSRFIKITKKRTYEALYNKSKVNEQISTDWGRRIVEINTLAKELWCFKCDIPLSFKNIQSETQLGLSNIFRVKCLSCYKIHDVYTNKHHTDHTQLYDVNFKLVIALIDAGIGEAQINTILSALNIPNVTGSLIQKYLKLVTPAFKAVANESCQKSIQLEKKMTIEVESLNNDILNENNGSEETQNTLDPGEVTLIGSLDTAWFRRGTGRARNSLTGHLALVGYRSGKIMGYAIRNKYCRCIYKDLPANHECTINYVGSSKAMEPDMAVELVVENQNLKKENTKIGILISDDDASIISAVRRASHEPIEKWSDLNHSAKSVANALYNLKLNQSTVKYFTRNFNYAIKQNKNNPTEVEKSIKNIVPHAYGEHANCGSWCQFAVKKENYRHHGLPKGKPFENHGIRDKLEHIFNRFGNNASKLSACGSTQKNESYNNLVLSKHPKARFYGASKTLHPRVEAAVCQSNEGTSYIMKINENLQLSPGKYTQKFRESKDKLRSKKSKNSQTTKFKARRLFKKRIMSQKNSSADKSEGITYDSTCGLDNILESVDESELDLIEEVDLKQSLFVVVDLETNGFGTEKAEICQISAKHKDATFNAYSLPLKKMSPGAENVTGLEDLARDFLGPEFAEGLHNAVQDVKILSMLINKTGVPDDKIISMAKSTPFILADRALKQYFKGAITSVIVSKIALARINLTTLRKAFQLGGYESVKILLAENVNNNPRVTKNEKTIKAIVDRLDEREKKIINK